MRLSCSGCRVLRKGCSEDCAIRPCLQWIKTSQSQANATLFLAKFYGRAGLLNLINAGPQHLRPAIFKSLLYEACGRIVNPIFGSTGLMLSGSWHLCQAAVEAVLKGEAITQLSSETAVGCVNAPLKAFDIRHVAKEESSAAQLHKVKSKSRFKRPALKPKPSVKAAAELRADSDNVDSGRVMWKSSNDNELASNESGTSRQPSQNGDNGEGDSVSVETVEASIAKPDSRAEADGSDVELELTLAIGPTHSSIRRF